MCGIFGYVGSTPNAASIIREGLKRLDYRGYDSWGIAVCDKDIFIEKQAGKIWELKNIEMFPESSIGIGHTRWATTGSVTKINAHPHFSTDKSFALAQNGIVDNYEELKNELSRKGYTFVSETDTEVIVRLIEDELTRIKDLQQAIRLAFLRLGGRNTIIVLTEGKEIYAARNGSPLVIGFGTDTVYLSSDTLSFAPFAKKMLVIENGQMVKVSKEVRLFDIKTDEEIFYSTSDINISSGKIDKEGYDHFMIKEIHESPLVLDRLIKQDEKTYYDIADAIKKAKHVYTIGSGGAGVAASQIAFYLRSIGKIHAISLIGADADEYVHLFSPDDLIIAISQSGETADVLEILEGAQAKGTVIASFINMPGSMINRMSDYKFMSESGPEICVMSTKTFVSQVAWGYLIAKAVQGKFSEGKKEIQDLAEVMRAYLADKHQENNIREIAKTLLPYESIFLLGKQQTFHIMREGMVKIIESAYKHGHALPSGDLKHYVITLIQKGIPVIAALPDDVAKKDVLSAIDQVRARGAKVYGISSHNYEQFDYHLPIPETKETAAIMTLLPLQLLGYYMAKELGNNIDRPRNIAKSVTVK